MTRNERKMLIRLLGNKFLASTDAATLKELKEEILMQVSTCKYTPSFAAVSLAVRRQAKEFDYYIDSVKRGRLDDSQVQAVDASINGLMNIIDQSNEPA